MLSRQSGPPPARVKRHGAKGHRRTDARTHGRTGARTHGRTDAQTQGRTDAHVEHEYLFGDRAMGGVVLVLSALTLVLGYLGGFFAARLPPGMAPEGPFAFGTGPLVALALVAAGIALAWFEFGARGASRVGFAERNPAVRDFLAHNWYVDRLYDATVVRWAVALSRAARWNDHTVLDGASDGVAQGTVWGGRILSMAQNGYVQAYLATAISVVAALGIWLVRIGNRP